jgi:hypothetical protein
MGFWNADFGFKEFCLSADFGFWIADFGFKEFYLILIK